MQVRMTCDGKDLFVSPFVGRFTANVCLAIVKSLKAPASTRCVRFDLDGEDLQLQVDETRVALDPSQGFAGTIVRDTIRGMLGHLKGMQPGSAVRIQIDLEGENAQEGDEISRR